MNTRLIALCTLALSLATLSARAEVEAPSANLPYQRLRAVELKPANAPRLQEGPQSLAQREKHFSEKLPVQLSGAIARVKATKYVPGKKVKTIRF